MNNQSSSLARVHADEWLHFLYKVKGSPFQKIQIFFTSKTAHMYYQWFFWFTTTNGKGKEIMLVHAKFLNTPVIKN